MFAQPSFRWILVNVTQHSVEIIIIVHRFALKAVLKQVANSPVFDIIPIYPILNAKTNTITDGIRIFNLLMVKRKKIQIKTTLAFIKSKGYSLKDVLEYEKR